eukprot:949388-Prorocentrum_lima.AAC.1
MDKRSHLHSGDRPCKKEGCEAWLRTSTYWPTRSYSKLPLQRTRRYGASNSAVDVYEGSRRT